MRGVDAFDVEGRVGFGVAQLLRVLQRGVEVQPLVAHFRQDEVGGAVDDAGDPVDAVGGQALAQRLDDRNAARHRRFERDHHALGAGRGEDFGAVLGEQCLVGGDDVLAGGNRLQHQFARAMPQPPISSTTMSMSGSAITAAHRRRRRRPADHRERALGVEVGDHADLDAATGAAQDFLLIAAQHLVACRCRQCPCRAGRRGWAWLRHHVAPRPEPVPPHFVSSWASSMRVALAVVVEEARDAADGVGEIVVLGRKTTRKWSGWGQLKPVPCTISTFSSASRSRRTAGRRRSGTASGRAAGTGRARPSA